MGWPLLLTMVQDNQAGWLIKYSATVVVGVAVATLIWRRAWKRKRDCRRTHDSHDMRTTEEASTSEDSELKCSCGLPAKLRISRTFRNPYRLFYNCPKNAFHHVSPPYLAHAITLVHFFYKPHASASNIDSLAS